MSDKLPWKWYLAVAIYGAGVIYLLRCIWWKPR